VAQDGDQIRSYAIQDGGTLTLQSSVESLPATEIIAEPTGRFLFGFADVTTCCHSPRDVDLLTYEIARDGGLSLSDRLRLDLYHFPNVLTATSRSLYMLTYGSYHAAFHVRPLDGSSPGGVFEAQTFEFPSAMFVSRSERAFYAMGGAVRGSEDYGVIEGYRLGADGRSEFVASLSMPPASVSWAVHPSGRFLYASTGAAESWRPPVTEQILIYAADDAGGLASAGSLLAPLGSLTPHPDGRFLYSSRGNEIDVYAVDSGTGALRLIDHALTTGLPSSISRWTADPTGRFLYASGGGQIWGYAIGTFGSLRFLGSLGAGRTEPIIVTPPTAH
jgi:6-phosphogluconolactonase (cycloisomerase 2 family)